MPVFIQTILNIIHWPTDQIPFCILFTEMYGKCYFWKFSTHSKKCGDPHPEDCSRSADCDRSCNSCNIPGSNRRRKRGTDRLKWCHCTICGIFFPKHAPNRHLHSVWKFSDLDKSGSDTEHKSYSDDTDHCRHTPDKIIDYIIDRLNRR